MQSSLVHEVRTIMTLFFYEGKMGFIKRLQLTKKRCGVNPENLLCFCGRRLTGIGIRNKKSEARRIHTG